jgi:cell division protein FtsB
MPNEFGDENIIEKLARKIYDKSAPGMIGVFVRQDAGADY